MIQFKNKKNELGLLGSNESGQLGLEIRNGDLKESKSSINILNNSELKTFDFENTTEYEIIDISAADNFTLVLIKFDNEKKYGNRHYLYKFSLFIKDRIKPKEGQKFLPISKEEFKYDQYARIKHVYATSERIVLLTEDNSVFVKGCDFNMEIFDKYKEIVRNYEKTISYLCLGKNHCLLMFSKDYNLFILIKILGDYTVYGLGLNQYGELGIKSNKFQRIMVKLNYFESKRLKIKKIAAGARHTLVITNDYQLYSFGDNSEGQCTGENECYYIPKKIKFPNGDKVNDVYAGYNHSVAITLLGDVYTWGDSSHNKLGYSTMKSIQNVPKIIPFMKDKEIFQIFTGPMHTALVTDSSESNKKIPKPTNIVHDYGAVSEETIV